MFKQTSSALSDNQIYNLQAGYETDKIVAHEVFKWEYSMISEDNTPRYSGDVSVAWRLFTYLKNHKSGQLIEDKTINISFVERYWFVNLRGCKSFDTSLSVAICQVALLYANQYLP